MNISQNRVVSLSYQLRYDNRDGEIIETVTAERPLVFIYGRENLIPEFERRIGNLKPGDDFSFALTSGDAYGPEEPLVELSKTVFLVDGQIDDDLLVKDNVIPMTDQHGHHVNGIVAEVKEDTVLVDFNHPLAGEDLFFAGTVVDVREATPEELAHGHIHDGGCSSGDCGGCSGGCH